MPADPRQGVLVMPTSPSRLTGHSYPGSLQGRSGRGTAPAAPYASPLRTSSYSPARAPATLVGSGAPSPAQLRLARPARAASSNPPGRQTYRSPLRSKQKEPMSVSPSSGRQLSAYSGSRWSPRRVNTAATPPEPGRSPTSRLPVGATLLSNGASSPRPSATPSPTTPPPPAQAPSSGVRSAPSRCCFHEGLTGLCVTPGDPC